MVSAFIQFNISSVLLRIDNDLRRKENQHFHIMGEPFALVNSRRPNELLSKEPWYNESKFTKTKIP